ncbi:DUF262 domain-containing protein [Steroidobacter agaridevorans]|uniref:DUF262 domain-containing protein n=1 Tax=Steroidobacter agaridevorans TaxID=2695856 RepID=UPI00132C4330|nr:DUF262 domain-containing protein [Steroidobacter agaridevorans]GFE90620.1 hypothetical protein GCM10011488_55740 [Steroidobacter agaridevorans]
MSIKYDSKREPLAEIIRKATVNATYVIPDLQRPYVWTPRQVTLLIDSLFKGWPFGSLLLWEVKPDCFDGDEGIPHRPFWQIVDRVNPNGGTGTSALGQPATYQMVLDGQQRVQSLVLALGGDQWGFQLNDADWAADLQDRRMKPSAHWSRASLCLDVTLFRSELGAKDKKVRKLEAGKILDWVVLDATNGRSTEVRPPNYVHPLLAAKEHPGRFIRLSRLWDLAQKDLSESEYEEILVPLLEQHSMTDSAQAELLRPLAQFMKVIENVKANSFVHALQIESLQLTPQWSKDDYSDAIVTIFTRLNTAGRTLTREEITLAWLKVGWVLSQTDGKTAGECLKQLKECLEDSGFKVETDEIVRLISFIWAVDHRKGNLLDSKDLLKGDVVRSMAGAVAGAWKALMPRIAAVSQLIEDRDLVENQGSFNAVIVFATWYRLVFDRLDSLQVVPLVKRDDLEKLLRQRSAHFLDRWIFGSQWANVWGEAAVRNFQDFASDLHSLSSNLNACTAETFLTTVDSGIHTLMERVSQRAISHITNTVVRERSRVYNYYPFLWVWHRLEKARWECSSVPMRTGRKRTSKLEVDHTVADAWWQRLVNRLVAAKQASFEGPDEEKAKLAPDGFTSRYDAACFVNALGNCSLLDKSFNISKSDKPMWAFLKEVHEFKQKKLMRMDWENALALNSQLTEPDGVPFDDIVKAISVRDAQIRSELTEFINGGKVRLDTVD